MRERRLAQLRRNLARYGFRLRVSPAWCAHGKFDIWDLRDNTFVFDLALEDAEKWLAKWEAGNDARTKAAYRRLLKTQERRANAQEKRASRPARPRRGPPRLRLVTS